MRNAFCSYCGTKFAPDAAWPRTCAACGETTYLNPTPVAVALLPVVQPGGERGLVVVRRDIDPGRGELGLPGGFLDIGESWREGAVRELREETGIVADASDVSLFDVHSGTGGGVLLVFGLLPERPAAELPPVIATDETSEWLVITGPRRLVFPTHTDAAASYFAQAGGQAAADRARYEPDGRPSRNSTTRAAGFSS
jgi:ADP-ribose pyrophosphatase YjhB (NUDIX family)